MKVLITEATQVNLGDARGGVHHEAGEMPDVTKETARSLTLANRALYTVRTDDPNKDGRYTASKDMVKAAEDLAKSKAAGK